MPKQVGVPTLICPCGEQIALPRQTQEGTTGGLYYWPKDSETLTLVCPQLGHPSVHSESDIRQVVDPKWDPNLFPLLFWWIECECDKENCKLPIVFHAVTPLGVGPGEATRMALYSRPNLTCVPYV